MHKNKKTEYVYVKNSDLKNTYVRTHSQRRRWHYTKNWKNNKKKKWRDDFAEAELENTSKEEKLKKMYKKSETKNWTGFTLITRKYTHTDKGGGKSTSWFYRGGTRKKKIGIVRTGKRHV